MLMDQLYILNHNIHLLLDGEEDMKISSQLQEIIFVHYAELLMKIYHTSGSNKEKHHE